MAPRPVPRLAPRTPSRRVRPPPAGLPNRRGPRPLPWAQARTLRLEKSTKSSGCAASSGSSVAGRSTDSSWTATASTGSGSGFGSRMRLRFRLRASGSGVPGGSVTTVPSASSAAGDAPAASSTGSRPAPGARLLVFHDVGFVRRGRCHRLVLDGDHFHRLWFGLGLPLAAALPAPLPGPGLRLRRPRRLGDHGALRVIRGRRGFCGLLDRFLDSRVADLGNLSRALVRSRSGRRRARRPPSAEQSRRLAGSASRAAASQGALGRRSDGAVGPSESSRRQCDHERIGATTLHTTCLSAGGADRNGCLADAASAIWLRRAPEIDDYVSCPAHETVEPRPLSRAL